MHLQEIEDCVRRNYNSAKRQTTSWMKSMTQSRMRDHIKHYHCTKERCACSDNKLISAMLQVDFPCCHRLFLGADFPPCPTVIPTIHQQWTQLEIEFEILPEETLVSSQTEESFDKEYITKQIRRYSHFKDIKLISDFVESHYKYDSESFISKQPISVIDMITEGVTHFSAMRSSEKPHLE